MNTNYVMRMKAMLKSGTMLLLAMIITNASVARYLPYRGVNGGVNQPQQTRAAGCAPATALTKMEFNNVSALIETGGSMWQDRATGTAAYEVPKGSNLRVMFAGALWMGGKDFNDQLKVAAITFRTNNDFWPGPLLTDGTAEVDAATCLKYDRFYATLRQDVITFVAYQECLLSGDPDCMDAFEGYAVPESIKNWPGNNFDPGYAFNLAPFYDANSDGVYEWEAGDYPWYDVKKELTCGNDRTVTLYGDQNYWWVFNDKGNIHTETGADPIGMEIKAQAFAFSTNDEVNDMTFYNYELINRGTQTLYQTYFGQWADPDVGFSDDDFVGCDVQRGLGYAYNGDAYDDAGNGQDGYGSNPPAVGIDFFEGPFQDSDGLDNPLTTNISDAIDSLGIPYEGIGIGYGDNVTDNERFGMRKFVYYFRNDQTPLPAQGEPTNGTNYYRYLNSIWLDGTLMYYGGTGHQASAGAIANGLIECDYMFPGDSDPLFWGTDGVSVPQNWTEANEGNNPADRRFIQSAGPFTLTPGQKNNITVGVVYAKKTSGPSFNSVLKLRLADDKAQALFDNCFKILDAPDAPELTIQELNNELIVYITNPPSSSNYKEQYSELDPFIVLPDTLDGNVATSSLTQAQQDEISKYYFQGYKLYQLADATVSSSDLNDPDKARLIAQSDIKDGVGRLVNFIKDEDLGYDVPTLMVDGSDEGIVHSIRVQTDAFTQATLVNHRTYYFMCVAYAYNNYKRFDPNDPAQLDGQKKPYLESRKSPTGEIKAYTGIPHIPVPEAGGTFQNSQYGQGPEITRIEGTGNGGLWMDITSASENTLFSSGSNRILHPTYQANRGPIIVKVIDPLNVHPGKFDLHILRDASDSLTNSNWVLLAGEAMTVGDDVLSTGDTVVVSDMSIRIGNEQIIPELGISIQIEQISYELRGSMRVANPIGSTIEFADSSIRWLTGVVDAEGNTPQNWIRSGTQDQDCDAVIYPDVNDDPCIYNDYLGLDDAELFEGLADGTWAPYQLAAVQKDYLPLGTPISKALASTRTMLPIADLPSVDIVFTSDKSKWTRCAIIEMQEDPNLAEGNIAKQELRSRPSVNKEGQPDGATYSDGTPVKGMGWFPGYAIDIETGERLNMAFGEDSWLAVDNGRDMKFNPTSTLYSPFGDVIFGGKHYVYVFKNQDRDNLGANRMPAYDGGIFLQDMLKAGSSTGNKQRVWRSCSWVGTPMLEEGYAFNDPSQIPTTVRVKLRIEKTYSRYSTTPGIYLSQNDTSQAVNAYRPLYQFSLAELSGTVDMAANDQAWKDSILALINVVPNPYYAFSTYESGRVDTRVKITNLPENCSIKIYNVSGQLVRTYTKDSPITSLDWDLKNNVGIPIASGVYIIHVDVPEIGERVLKWFGAMRPPDLQSF